MSADFYKVRDEVYGISSYFFIDNQGRAKECDAVDARAWAKKTDNIIPEITISLEKTPEGAMRCLVEPTLDDGEEDNPNLSHRYTTAKVTSTSKGRVTAEVYMGIDKELIDSEYWQKRLTRIIAACEVERLSHSVSENEAVLFISQAGIESIATINLDTYEIKPIGQINIKQQMSLFPEITQVPLLFYCDMDISDESFIVPQIYMSGTRVSNNLSLDDELAIPKDMAFKDMGSFLVGSTFGLWDTLGQPRKKNIDVPNNTPDFEQIQEGICPTFLRELDIDKFRKTSLEMFLRGVDNLVKDCVKRQQLHTSTFGIVIREPENGSEQYSLLILEDSGLFKGNISKEFATKLMDSLPVYAYIIENMSGKSSVGVMVKELEPIVAVDVATIDDYEEVYKFYNRAMVTASVLGNCNTFDSGILDADKEFSETVAECEYTPEEGLVNIYDIQEIKNSGLEL